MEDLGGQVVMGRPGVVPRVVGADGEVLPLEFYVEGLLQRGFCGVVNLVGKKGSGKSVALRHVAGLFGDKIIPLDDKSPEQAGAMERDKLVIFTSKSRSLPAKVHYVMADWGQDEVVEYLLAKHRDKCGSVMKRLQKACRGNLFSDAAEVWAAVLEEFAANEELADVPEALRRRVMSELGDASRYQRASELSLEKLANGNDTTVLSLGAFARLLVHRIVMVAVAGKQLALELKEGRYDFLGRPVRRDLVEEAAGFLRGRGDVADKLVERIRRRIELQPMGASLLLAMDPRWRPGQVGWCRFVGAHLRGVKWSGIFLAGADLVEANLHGADLSEANLRGADAQRASLRQANLRGTQMDKIKANGADFSLADLTGASAADAQFSGAIMEGAKFCGAILSVAMFDTAELSRGNFAKAYLVRACFRHTRMEETDFSGADFTHSRWQTVDMSKAIFSGASFRHAMLLGCNLEGAAIEGMDFTDARFNGSYLTGSTAREATFFGAKFHSAGLAEVNWERADLRDADFSKASFHMGSSRSGRVGSDIASEGTRTGFYTDDYNEQDYKAPEEIRKANLRGCDLTGAKVEGTDWYLVDLRDAIYSKEQGEHFARCGAILRGR